MGIVADFCDRIVVMYAGRIVESAKTKDLFSSTSHPYTIGLLNSIPSATSDKKKLYSIIGSVPHPKEYRKGCRFFDRCEKRITECESDVPPPLFKVGEGHKAACWLYENTAE
jgi:oligopeptide/dipeptide ABC transporter ATP-binding protein